MKMSAGRDELLQLHEQALLADVDMQRIEGLHSSSAVRGRNLSHSGDIPRSTNVRRSGSPQYRAYGLSTHRARMRLHQDRGRRPCPLSGKSACSVSAGTDAASCDTAREHQRHAVR